MFQFTRDFGIESLSRVVDEQLWSVAPDFHALCRLNCMFLRGQLEFTPYHSGPLLVETVPLVPALLELHEYGVFTYESNPYELALVAEDMSVEYEQRPYLNCVLSASHSAAWLDFFEALKLSAWQGQRMWMEFHTFASVQWVRAGQIISPTMPSSINGSGIHVKSHYSNGKAY
ncbi:hypothetical protein BST61_g11302 [Cercospora zeina]